MGKICSIISYYTDLCIIRGIGIYVLMGDQMLEANSRVRLWVLFLQAGNLRLELSVPSKYKCV